MLRQAPEMLFINRFNLARLPAPDAVVLVESSPAKRMAALRASGKELDPRHNEAYLERLQEGYRRAVATLEKRGRVTVFTDDGADPTALAERIAAGWPEAETAWATRPNDFLSST